MSDDMRELFREGAMEHLRELEQALLILEERPDDHQEINRVFRVMHTIKGSAAMVGLEDVSAFAHKLENEFDRIRMGQAAITPLVIDGSLEARDLLMGMVEAHFGGEAVDTSLITEILAKLTAGQAGRDDVNPLETAGTEMLRLTAGLDRMVDQGPSDDLIRYVAGQIKIVREFCRCHHAENVNEFLHDFEDLFRDAASGRLVLPADLLVLSRAACDEAAHMINEALNPGDLSVLDPMAIIAACERPREILKTLQERRGSLAIAAAPPVPDRFYRIRIQVGDLSKTKLHALLNILRSLGECEVAEIPVSEELHVDAA